MRSRKLTFLAYKRETLAQVSFPTWDLTYSVRQKNNSSTQNPKMESITKCIKSRPNTSYGDRYSTYSWDIKITNNKSLETRLTYRWTAQFTSSAWINYDCLLRSAYHLYSGIVANKSLCLFYPKPQWKNVKIIIYNQASYLIVVSPNKEQKRLVPTAVVLNHGPTEVKKLG